jgi:hypothetical protein
MSGTPLYRPRVTREPDQAVVVSAGDPSLLVVGVPVSALPFALPGTPASHTNRRAGGSGTHWAVYRSNAARPARDARPHKVSVLTRAATFSWNGVAAAPVVARDIDINAMEGA